MNIVRISIEKIQISLKSDKNDATLREDQYTFWIVSRSILRVRNFSDKFCRQNQDTHFIFSNFFSIDNRAVYETLLKNIVDQIRPQVTTWGIRIASWVPKSTNTH